MDSKNTTTLNSEILETTFRSVVAGWPTEPLVVRVRWSRGAEFSGTCFYDTHRIYININRNLQYPYRMFTHCARSVRGFDHYYKPISYMEMCDGYQVCQFVFAHEFYHWLIKRAGRNTQQKESMCDRFAARTLMTMYGCMLYDKHHRVIPVAHWNFQDLDGFVERARSAQHDPIMTPCQKAARETLPTPAATQLLLFD